MKKHRAEATKVSIYEFDQELFAKQTRQEGYEEGVEQGIQQGRVTGKLEGTEESMKLLKILLAEGRMEDINRITTDAEYRNQLMIKYQIL